MDHAEIAKMAGEYALDLSMPGRPAVIEVGLLLSSNQVDALVALSRRTHRSVAQMLREWIDDALAAESITEGLLPIASESPVQ